MPLQDCSEVTAGAGAGDDRDFPGLQLGRLCAGLCRMCDEEADGRWGQGGRSEGKVADVVLEERPAAVLAASSIPAPAGFVWLLGMQGGEGTGTCSPYNQQNLPYVRAFTNVKQRQSFQ